VGEGEGVVDTVGIGLEFAGKSSVSEALATTSVLVAL